MGDDRKEISSGPNGRPINESIAGTAAGMPDEAISPGEQLPEPPNGEQMKDARQALGVECEEADTLPLDGK